MPEFITTTLRPILAPTLLDASFIGDLSLSLIYLIHLDINRLINFNRLINPGPDEKHLSRIEKNTAAGYAERNDKIRAWIKHRLTNRDLN